MVNKFHISLHGLNFNLFDFYELDKHSHTTFAYNIIADLSLLADRMGTKINYFQSNMGNVLLDYIPKAQGNINFIVINSLALTDTSIALWDVLLVVNISLIEIHLSNMYAREPFYHYSYLSDLAVSVICNLGTDGYHFALKTAVKRLSKSN